jgi:hypothetical protein
MRPLIVANVEYIEASPFLVAILYGQDGQRLDEMILPFESYELALQQIRELAKEYRIQIVGMWTSDKELYILSLQTPGIAGVIKHPSDTVDTRQTIEHNSELLKELYQLTPKPPLPRWKAFLVCMFRKILNRLEGADRYEI